MSDTIITNSEAVAVVPLEHNGSIVDTSKLTGRERSNLNLRSWKPGQRGNPHNKNRRKTFTHDMNAILDQLVEPGKTGTKQQLLAMALLKQAMKGSPASAKLILERTDPAQTHVHKSEVLMLQLVFNDANPPDKWAPIDVDAIAHTNQHELPATLEDDDDEGDE